MACAGLHQAIMLTIQDDGKHQYIDEGQGEVLLLLHGLFGTLSNWDAVVDQFKDRYRVVIPMMPLYTISVPKAGIKGLTKYIESFVEDKGLKDLTLIGNSLGGHIGLFYITRNAEKVRRLVLTGSSGLYENTMGGSFPKRGSYDFVQEKVGYTFYDPNIATKELVDEVYDVTTSRSKVLRVISIARSAQKHNMGKDIKNMHVPTLLVWGLNDTITPPFVAHEFHSLMPNSELKFIDECCHAPMMEHPEQFNAYLEDFLERHPL